MSAYGAVSLFSGCGGFCEGIRQAGFEIRAAVESDGYAAQTHARNFGETQLFVGDVADFLNIRSRVWNHEIGRFGTLRGGEVALVFGGPPCQGYSQIGRRDASDPRNTLYLQFTRVVRKLQPAVCLMENVPNMLALDAGRFKRATLTAIKRAGYRNAGVVVVDAKDYGVPQRRRRAIFVGIRNGLDLGGDAATLLEGALEAERQSAVTVSQALGDLPEKTATGSEPIAYPATQLRNPILDELRLDRSGRWYAAGDKMALAGGEPYLYNHHTKDIQSHRSKLIRLLEPGARADSLPAGMWNGSRPHKWRRLHPDQPAYAILAQMHRDLSEWVHPVYHRWITVREAARLQSFHDGFVFEASEWQMLKQIGNAVPPLLARALGSAVRRILDGAAAV